MPLFKSLKKKNLFKKRGFSGLSFPYDSTSIIPNFGLFTESGDLLKAEDGTYLLQEFFFLLTEAGDLLGTENNANLVI